MTLALDQRWLLRHMGGSLIVWALTDPAGTKYLMGTMWSSTGGRKTGMPDSAPAWLAGFETRAGVIRSTHQGGRPVKVSAKQIDEFARSLPADVRAELIQCRKASQANAHESYLFCRCGSTPCSYAYMGDRICPPSEDQENANHAEHWRIREWQDDLLTRALGLGDTGLVGQLELFGATA